MSSLEFADTPIKAKSMSLDSSANPVV